jgi:DNA-directed RNA polymerase subunit RPC12/RpoP
LSEQTPEQQKCDHPDWMILTYAENPISCPGCGTILSYKSCEKCGKEVLKFGNGFDDVVADASISESGDLICTRCALYYDDEEEDYDNSDVEDWTA